MIFFIITLYPSKISKSVTKFILLGKYYLSETMIFFLVYKNVKYISTNIMLYMISKSGGDRPPSSYAHKAEQFYTRPGLARSGRAGSTLEIDSGYLNMML